MAPQVQKTTGRPHLKVGHIGRPGIKLSSPTAQSKARSTRLAFRTLAPAISATASHPHSTRIQPTRKSCQVAICSIPNCSLRSHRLYPATSSQAVPARHRASTASKLTSASVLAIATSSTTTARQVNCTPGHDVSASIMYKGVDGMPALPIDEGQEVYRELFHHFFSRQYDLISHIISPRPTTSAQKQRYLNAKKRSFEAALEVPVFCLHFCAASHHQFVFQRDSRRPNKTTSLIYNKMISLLRSKLTELEDEPGQMSDVALVILTIVMFETSNGNYSALDFHRKAMHQIAKRQGGVYNMGVFMPYMLILDRTIAIYSDLPPLLEPMPNRAIRLPVKHPPVYGKHFEAFDRDQQEFLSEDQNVSTYCFDACRAIELKENDGVSFDPPIPEDAVVESNRDGDSNSKIGNQATNPKALQQISPVASSSDEQYFFYLRGCLHLSFCYLNARLAASKTLRRSMTRLTLLVAQIVIYATIHNCYMVGIPLRMANLSRDLIQDLDLQSLSDHELDLIIWCLFVMSAMPLVWEGQTWSNNMLVELLSGPRRYGAWCRCSSGTGSGELWPENWRSQQHETVRNFVWAESCFGTGFVEVCDRLEDSMSHQCH